MIRYTRSPWFQPILRWRGSVFQLLLKPLTVYVAYASLVYACCRHFEVDVVLVDDKGSTHFFGGCVSFLLIFRLNQCYRRYCLGIDFTAEYFVALHGVVSTALAYLKGADEAALKKVDKADDSPHERRVLMSCIALSAKVHIMRLCLAIGVAFKFHCRVADSALSGDPMTDEEASFCVFDYIRIKGLLYPQEHHILGAACGIYSEETEDTAGCCSGPVEEKQWRANLTYQPAQARDDQSASDVGGKASQQRTLRPVVNLDDSDEKNVSRPLVDADYIGVPVPLVLIHMLRDYLQQPLDQEWGYPERVLNLVEIQLARVTKNFELLDRLITMPLPLSYLQHCKIIFIFFVGMYPFTVSTNNGFWANVVSPCLLFVGLLGFELIAEELENPIGDQEVDLNVLEMIHDLEIRAHEVFNLANKHALQTREVSCYPLRVMGLYDEELARHAKQLEQARETRETMMKAQSFFTHFAWTPVPPHVFMYFLEVERGVGFFRSRQIRKASITAAMHRTNAARLSGRLSPTLDAFSEEREENGLNQEGITHFICLKQLEPDVRAGCEKLARDYLDQFASGVSRQGTSSAMPSGASVEEAAVKEEEFGSAISRSTSYRLDTFSGVMRSSNHHRTNLDLEEDGMLQPRMTGALGSAGAWSAGGAS